MTSNCTPLVMDAVERASKRAAAAAHGEMRRGLYPLATIAASATLIGLLGTVVQLINHTFFSFGASRSTILGSIAGRLSEAMLPTALGLLVSIPALWFYRYLSSRMETFDWEMEHASAELVSRLVVHFGPLRKSAPTPKLPECLTDLAVGSPRLSIERMFRHGVLELIWPRFTTEFDAYSVLQGAMWVCFAYGFIACLNCYWDGRPTGGITVFLFFVVAGLRLRTGSLFSILSLFAVLGFAVVACLIPFGWTFSSACLAAAPILLVGGLKAARFLAGGWKSRAESRWATVRRLANIAIGLSALSACVAILFGTVLSLYSMGADYSMKPGLRPGDWIISVNASVMGEIHRGDLLAFPYYGNTTGIERVVGLPGDRIRVESGKVIRNGTVIVEPYVTKRYMAEWGEFPQPTEAFPDGFLRWEHANAYGAGPSKQKDFIVPANTYFLLNDNRNELMDSRILGPFNRRYIAGRAMFAYSPGSPLRLLR